MNSRCSRGQPDTRSIADVGHKASSKQIQGVQTGKQMQGMQTGRRVQGVQASKGNKGQGQGALSMAKRRSLNVPSPPKEIVRSEFLRQETAAPGVRDNKVGTGK